MTKNSAIPLDGIFVAPSTPSFADLMDQLSTNKTLTASRRKDLISGLRRVAEALDRAPAQVPADPRWLQPRISRIAPAGIGVSKKTWQNTVSNARNAMVACGIVTKRQRRPEDLSPSWRSLWAVIQASKDKSLLSPLPRFVFFLDRLGIAPSNVCNDHALLFREAVELNEISKNPKAAYEDAVMGWNRARDRLSAWPRQRLDVPSKSNRVMLPETEYAPDLIKDIDRYLEMRQWPDLLAPGRTLRPIAASSATTYRYMLLRFVSHVVGHGVAPQEITSMEALLQPAHVEGGLRQMLERNGGATCTSIGDTAGLLLTIAKHLGLPDETVRALTTYKERLAVHEPGGMTAKNRDRLRVLRNPDVLRRLLHLPEQIIARPLGQHRYKALRMREDAIAIGILLYCPLRVSNLSSLEIDRHLQRPGKGKMFLVIPASEVKNHRPIEFELPAHLVSMIDAHLSDRAPTLCAPRNPYLFPATRKDGPVWRNTLSERIKRRVRDEIGIEMNAHLFRHLAVMIYLDANPGGYEVARQMLGHSSTSRTISVYSGLETISATRSFASLVDKMREGM
ncbi:phage integrase [Roseobacter sp. AzwK-3b]|uniref:site-specific integrase n=1 Tax=Roseobacter sp. AzwK-3b TaxID=351016 RepID=UPI000156ACB8|nr:site-specific integrase [Roseobacter sp. AzwK-3b]EDM69983.1 phage integrase [Roseobacter sp. AzwK-3b]